MTFFSIPPGSPEPRRPSHRMRCCACPNPKPRKAKWELDEHQLCRGCLDYWLRVSWRRFRREHGLAARGRLPLVIA